MEVEPDGLDRPPHDLQVGRAVVPLPDALAGLAEEAIDDVAGDFVRLEPAREAPPRRVEVDGVLAGVLGGAAGGFEVFAEELGASGAMRIAVLVGEDGIGGLGLAADEEDPAVGFPFLQGLGGERVEREQAVCVLRLRAGRRGRARRDLLGDADGGVVEVGPGEPGELAVPHAAGEGQQVANAAHFREFLGFKEALGFCEREVNDDVFAGARLRSRDFGADQTGARGVAGDQLFADCIVESIAERRDDVADGVGSKQARFAACGRLRAERDHEVPELRWAEFG